MTHLSPVEKKPPYPLKKIGRRCTRGLPLVYLRHLFATTPAPTWKALLCFQRRLFPQQQNLNPVPNNTSLRRGGNRSRTLVGFRRAWSRPHMDGDESSAEEAGYGAASTRMACARRRYLVLISDTGPGQIRHAGPGRILLQSLRRRAPPSVPVDALAVTTGEVPERSC